ncbi:MAG: hypothetical protein COZ06_31905 [Armatimonadetes bacterium CG_4_10_14_3_um_filter_66_18]|nr:MAG: hypothetical protein COS65_28720 [Armatimonadetes bacterium CG06_land_8_20_14_3_00_66_21]PIX38344.1 MAG: hypothetical protein COZ57_30790 [Armatimonadetes bacterium CG_4_8_14_3_um_filter_66_20]PIY37967.1 MAG: hypothetical protein COZ06_31905 [Armatimonadetes bacterium CG_4_10_14_3_um_filter_66_18]PIZ31518.1 MAG: hypothetical protein COY42_32490 [Armatimonadetes bacterium CG_4_10_14_0_8_um_filter_66_14]PJB61059.1 MAG: hypothetical protein CO096_30770 [Armatimonadetes bacterium CG_4_9_14_
MPSVREANSTVFPSGRTRGKLFMPPFFVSWTWGEPVAKGHRKISRLVGLPPEVQTFWPSGLKLG